MKVIFLGATNGVTGSSTLLEVNNKQYIIDCGLNYSQTLESQIERIKEYIVPGKLNSIFLTHAHLDHCGLIPHLIKEGFHGNIFGTQETLEIALVNINDYVKHHLQSYRNGEISNKLFSDREVRKFKNLFKVIKPGKIYSHDFDFQFISNGHILGSCMIEIKYKSKRLLFSGDLGKTNDLLTPLDIDKVNNCHFLICEATYGGKLHERPEDIKVFEELISECIDKNKQAIIPSFSIARTQKIIHILNMLLNQNPKFKNFRIYLDSPMGQKVTKIYQKHKILKYNNKKFIPIRNRLGRYSFLKSKAPSILLTSSGMLNGGPAQFYLPYIRQDESKILCLVGYQAEKTPGREVLERNSYNSLELRCEVKSLDNYSAHADKKEILEFIKKSKASKVFLIHGEKDQKEILQKSIKDELSIDVMIPQSGFSIELF